MTVRPEVVDLWLRCTFGEKGNALADLLVDGRPATEEERAIVGSTVLHEVEAAVNLMRLAEEVAIAEAEAAVKADAMLRPYFEAGAGTVGQCLDRMPEAERAECIEQLEACGFGAWDAA